MSALATDIVRLIEYDILDRGGLRQPWLSMDSDTKEDIRVTWQTFIDERVEFYLQRA